MPKKTIHKKNKSFTSDKITYIENPKILTNNDFPKFIYDGGDGFKTLKITLSSIQNNEQNGGLFGFFDNKSSNKKIPYNIDSLIYAEGGAMNYMTNDVTLVSSAKNRWIGSFLRSLSGGTFFLSSIVNEGKKEGIVSLSPPTPGDIGCFYIPPGKTFIIVSNSYIASTNNLKISSVAKLGGVITGYGIFYTSIESVDNNAGLVWISSFGKLTEYLLKPNEKINVDNGIILAFDSSVQFSTSLAGKGLLSSIFSKEGLISVFENNTNSNITIYLQGRSIKSYNDYIANIASKVYIANVASNLYLNNRPNSGLSIGNLSPFNNNI
jgi:uncharacterized protein (TIGR00266 family)